MRTAERISGRSQSLLRIHACYSLMRKNSLEVLTLWMPVRTASFVSGFLARCASPAGTRNPRPSTAIKADVRSRVGSGRTPWVAVMALADQTCFRAGPAFAGVCTVSTPPPSRSRKRHRSNSSTNGGPPAVSPSRLRRVEKDAPQAAEEIEARKQTAHRIEAVFHQSSQPRSFVGYRAIQCRRAI